MTKSWPLIPVLSTAVLAALIVTGVQGPARVAAAMWFLFTAPGMALVPLLGNAQRRFAAPMVVAVSVAADTAVVTAQVVLGKFSAPWAFVVLAIVCGIGCALQIARGGTGSKRTEIRFY